MEPALGSSGTGSRVLMDQVLSHPAEQLQFPRVGFLRRFRFGFPSFAFLSSGFSFSGRLALRRRAFGPVSRHGAGRLRNRNVEVRDEVRRTDRGTPKCSRASAGRRRRSGSERCPRGSRPGPNSAGRTQKRWYLKRIKMVRLTASG